MTTRNRPRDAAVFGVDIGKNVFHVVGLDSSGQPVQRARFRRDTLLQFFERAAPAIVGMEACPGSQWLARKIQGLGHTVRIVPAQFVKPYVKSNKNDLIDAEAIAEAVTRPTMRFVEIKASEQVDIQALHRARDMMVMHRTRMISQMRAFCLEHGVTIHQGAGKFKADLPRLLADETNDLTPSMRRLLSGLTDAFGEMADRAAARGLRVTLEFMPISGITDLSTGWSIIAGADRANAGLCFDTWHYFRSGENDGLLATIPGSQVFEVQLADARRVLQGRDLIDDLLRFRLLPGEGDMPVSAALETLKNIGAWRSAGPEIFADWIDALDGLEAARRCASNLDKFI